MLRFVASHLSGNGGTETVLVQVLNELAKQGELSLTVMGTPENQEWLQRLHQNVRVSILNVNGKVHKLIAYLRCAAAVRNRDLVISLSPSFIRVLHAVRKIRRGKYPIVSWIHFSLADQNLFNAEDITLADYHLAISSKIKNQLMKLGVAGAAVAVIHNPVERQPLAVKSPHPGINLAFVGRITYAGQKNLQELLQGIARVDKANLFLVGTGQPDEVKKCKAAATRLGIADRVTWGGWQSDPWRYLADKDIDAVVLTSPFEGLPMVFLESMARGIPVVSSRFAGYDDVVRDGVNGMSYAPGDVAGLAKAINDVQSITNTAGVQASIEPYYADNYFAHLNKVLARLNEKVGK